MDIKLDEYKKVGYIKRAKSIESFEKKIGGSHFKCDYHIHSEFSHDGISKKEAIIKRAETCNIKYIAVTDHNTLNFPIEKIKEFGGFADSVFVKVSDNVKIIPAVEVTTRIALDSGRQKTVHIGVYAPDLSNKSLLRLLKIKEENEKNLDNYYFTAIEECLGCEFEKGAIKSYEEKLRKDDSEFKFFEKKHIVKYCKIIASEIATKNNSTKISKINLTSTEKRNEFVNKVEFIMDKVFHPSKFNIDAEELMQKAGYAGAITVLMHPNATFDNQEELDEVRKKLYSWGLFGEEKIYANKETMAKLTQPKENGVSGGTDSHNVYTKKLAIVDGIQLYADMFSITKKLEELEEKRKQNPKREDKEIADVSYIKYVPKYQNNMTPQDVMNKYKKITLAKKTEELEK